MFEQVTATDSSHGDVTQPEIGDTLYGGVAGSVGLLCEAYVHLRQGGRASIEGRIIRR